MILTASIFSFFLLSLPASAPNLIFDLRTPNETSTIPTEGQQEWRTRLLEAKLKSRAGMAGLENIFEKAKVEFLKHDTKAAYELLLNLESELFGLPLNSKDLKILVGKLEALRANLASATNNEAAKLLASSRVLAIASTLSEVDQKILLDLLPSSANQLKAEKKTQLFQEFSGSVWTSGWRNSDRSKNILYQTSIVPAKKEIKAIFIRTRPESLRDRAIKILISKDQELSLSADPLYWQADKNLADSKNKKSIWKSPWVWVLAGALAGGAGYLTYSQLQSGSKNKTP